MISPSSRQPVHPGTFYGGIVCAGSRRCRYNTVRSHTSSGYQAPALNGTCRKIRTKFTSEMDFGLRRRAAPAINESPNH
jgi:hypothetical protein